MLVTKSNFDEALLILSKEKELGFDTETTCLNWWKSPWHEIRPRVFSMQFATATDEFYFDFNHSSNKLGDKHFAILHRELTSNPEIYWFIANAKFDLHHSMNHGVEFAGPVHCTKAIARVVNNLEPALGLDDLAQKYLGSEKLDVISILKEREHLTKVKKFGVNDKYDEILHFDRLELQELVEYGKKDTRLCFDLGKFQLRKIEEINKSLPPKAPGLIPVLANEMLLTKVCYRMEREGVLIDRAYTEEAYLNEVAEYHRIEKELDALALQFVPKKVDWLSAKQLKPLFDGMGEKYTYTEKGNACFDRDALEDSDSEIAKLILKYRYHNKRAHTYFENFIWLADTDNVLHADAQQAGTGFGRMSYWTPNLQNIPKRRDKEELNFKVRRCFIPKPGTVLVDIDYTGAEYYMAVDYGREMPVVEQLKAGLDPHAKLATDMALKDRDTAKTMQFRILYGAGQEAIGKALGYKGFEAKKLGKAKKSEYFDNMPGVAKLISDVSYAAKMRGYIFNWFGRVLNYEANSAYKATNGLIQSGVGDMTKKAMVELDNGLLAKAKSRMLIQVHDALLFSMVPEELSLVPEIIKVMTGVYPHKVLPMSADAMISEKSWADLRDFECPVT